MRAREKIGSPQRECIQRVNLRPLLLAALGLVTGINAYFRIRFGGFVPSDLLFIAVFLFVAVRPVSFKRTAAVFLSVALCTGVGVGFAALASQSFLTRKEEGRYAVSGTVISVSVLAGRTRAVLAGLAFDGENVGGRLSVTLPSEEVRTGDVVLFEGETVHTDLSGFAADPYVREAFADDVRYSASCSSFVKTGERGLMPRLNAGIYDVLHAHLPQDEADLGYALLTGGSGGLDGTLANAVRRGGIAHIFAVSGLHIGILFGAAVFLCKKLGKFRFLPAAVLALFYSAMCGFTVSSLRAVVMCAAAGAAQAFGRKTDFLQNIALACIFVLTLFPAQWVSSGFRLSFGACVGLALFSGSISRGLAKLPVPAFLRNCLSAGISVWIFTAPLLLESFGYLSAFSILLNALVIPVLPVLFLGLLLCTLLALAMPFAAGFFLIFPKGMLSLFLFGVSFAEELPVIGGFALGTGGTVWLLSAALLSERFRLGRKGRAVLAAGCAALLAVCLSAANFVPFGCRIDLYRRGESGAALIRTPSASVLVIDGDISLAECEEFLLHTYGGELGAVVVLGEDAGQVNVAAFLGAREVRLREETDHGLIETPVRSGDSFICGNLSFRYESAERLVFSAENVLVELDFEDPALLGADLFLGEGESGLIFFLNNGIIEAL